MNVIEVAGVSKKFNRRTAPKLLRDHLKDRFRQEHSHNVFYALRDISFSVRPSEGVQIVGANGAGKSTLLGLIIGLMRPDKGRIAVHGSVGALLELGSGFHPDLTGLENLELNASLVGISQSRIRELTPRIIEFAELRDFIEEPLRTYSAGMMMRLAFAIAISTEPDILVVDEVLTVGDSAFQQKCFETIRRLRERGTALLCVSHGTIAAPLCSRAIWLHEGELMRDGDYVEVTAEYQRFMRMPGHERLPAVHSVNDSL